MDSPLTDSPLASALRTRVLAGTFFGSTHAATAAELAAFLVAPDSSVADWFGSEAIGRLHSDPVTLCGLVEHDICTIDALISAQLDAILHAPRLQRFEGTWRGLHWLVERADKAAGVLVKLLNATWAELAWDLVRAVEFDQSTLFRLIYEGEFGMPGGKPFGMLVVDHELSLHSKPGAADEMEALQLLSSTAAAAFAPTVIAASPALLGADDWAALGQASTPAATLSDPRWQALSAREDARFVAVALSRLLARPAWRDDPARRDGFRYQEYAPDAANRVWMNPGYALAAIAVRAYAKHGWPADISGVDQDREGGAIVTGLPIEDYPTDPRGSWVRPPIEVVFNNRQERALAEAGLMPVTALPFGPDLAFAAMRTLQAPRRFGGPGAALAGASARISAQFHAVLCVSRFAHAIKVMGRDMVGGPRGPDDVQQRLQEWLHNYVDTSTGGGPETGARKPLREGRVEVREQPGRPGALGCTMWLQPHYQLEDVSATFRLFTELAPAAAAT